MKPFFGGVPTGPDVRKLNEKFPDLKVGDVIGYEEVELVLGIKHGSSRWRSVTEAWRQDQEDNGVVVDCKRGEAFFVASNPQVFDKAHDATRSSIRKLRRTARKISVITPENEIEQATADHSRRILYLGAKTLADLKKQLIKVPKLEQLPMRQPPAEEAVNEKPSTPQH